MSFDNYGNLCNEQDFAESFVLALHFPARLKPYPNSELYNCQHLKGNMACKYDVIMNNKYVL